MRNKLQSGLLLFILALSCCKGPADKFAPVGEEFMSRPAEKISVEEMKNLQVAVETDYGSFTIAFYPDQAPNTTRNFIKLVQQGFYNGLYFHMVVPNYMVIGGDPKGDGQGGPGYWIKPEFNTLPHVRAMVGMSHPPFAPDMIGSQFFVMVTNSIKQTNAYPVFGHVVSGMATVDRISDIPTSGPNGKPGPWKPKVIVHIQKMTILKKEGA
jgi:peptidyl-prolyl cis-trans isomerase B (cyclophilin B)